jgi:squalene-hopene/tetraprenyl-beta-curcumene cyclase
MPSRLALLWVAAAVPACGGDWNPRLAAQYLDSRQEKWFSWPAAMASGTCVSCHTGAAYLLVRPALRRALGESQPTAYETGLPAALRGVESIFAALFLAVENPKAGTLSSQARQVFDRRWSLQVREGSAKGGWAWFSLNLDPREMPESAFYGASLAALASGAAPAEYRDRPAVRERVAALTAYLRREWPAQPPHNRLMALWASSKLPDAPPASILKPILDEIRRKQQPDGSWTMESLGPWKEHPQAPHAAGDCTYATGFTAVVLEKAGIAAPDVRLRRALDWLKAHQDPKAGYWDGGSMNRPYPADSMMALFMRDAATEGSGSARTQ